MSCYKEAYFKVFCSSLDILEDLDELRNSRENGDKTAEKLDRIISDIKKMHQEGDQKVISGEFLYKIDEK